MGRVAESRAVFVSAPVVVDIVVAILEDGFPHVPMN